MRELTLSLFLVSMTALFAGLYLFPAIASALELLRQGELSMPVVVLFLSVWGAASIMVALGGLLIQIMNSPQARQARTSAPPPDPMEPRKPLYPPEVSAIAVAAARRRCRAGTVRVVVTNPVPASPSASEMPPVFATRRGRAGQ